MFADYLGVKKVLWLDRGIAGDDTHGHIDDLARFVGPADGRDGGRERTRDENYAPLQENLERLRGMTDLDGRKLEVVPLPMPRPLVFDGARLPASYANFYIANGVVIVPTFNDPAGPRWRWARWRSCSPTARWSASTASIWSGASARCTA